AAGVKHRPQFMLRRDIKSVAHHVLQRHRVEARDSQYRLAERKPDGLRRGDSYAKTGVAAGADVHGDGVNPFARYSGAGQRAVDAGHELRSMAARATDFTLSHDFAVAQDCRAAAF